MPITLKEFTPSILVKLYKSATRNYGWFGDYSSWQKAKKDSTGYDSTIIAEKVKDALLKVKNGEAVYERDSFLFDKIEYSWPLLGGIMWVAAQNNGTLNLLDFGGSLGSTYFQNKKFLVNLKKVNWSIVEQKIFVELGSKYFEDDIVKFYTDIENCYKQQNPNTVLFSGVLQYLEFPYQILESTFKHKPQFIIVDNMPFLENRDRITLQKVHSKLYSASYPCWLLNKKEFLNFFSSQYEVIADFKSGLSIQVGLIDIPYDGFIFRRIVK